MNQMPDNKKEEPVPTPPLPKVKLYAGVGFWSKAIIILDKKLESLCTNYGYGEVSFKIVVHRGRPVYTLFNDQIQIKEGENGDSNSH